MKNTFLAAIGATMLAPLPALAGGMASPVTEPAIVAPPVVAIEVTPDWTGFYAGGALGYGNISSTDGIADGSGPLGGLLAGYRWDFGTFVAGVEADYDWASIDLGKGAGTLDDIYRVKLQAGADMGSTLVYGTAGLAWASGEFGGKSGNADGWVAGIGADHDLGNNWTLGGEVLWHSFDDAAGSGVDVDATTAKVRVAYRF